MASDNNLITLSIKKCIEKWQYKSNFLAFQYPKEHAHVQDWVPYNISALLYIQYGWYSRLLSLQGHCTQFQQLQCRAIMKGVNPHKIHPIPRPLGRGMGCILWVQTMIYTLPHSPQWCKQYYVILDRIITAVNLIKTTMMEQIQQTCIQSIETIVNSDKFIWTVTSTDLYKNPVNQFV